MLRSPHAHARITDLDVTEARAAEGVRCILTADEVADLNPIRCVTPLKQPDGTMSSVPDIDGNPDDYDILSGALEPGDTIVFNFRTLHGTTDAPLKARRRAFSLRWFGDDVTYCDRPGETSPSFPDINLNHGDIMREDWFPVIWRA